MEPKTMKNIDESSVNHFNFDSFIDDNKTVQNNHLRNNVREFIHKNANN